MEIFLKRLYSMQIDFNCSRMDSSSIIVFFAFCGVFMISVITGKNVHHIVSFTNLILVRFSRNVVNIMYRSY